MIGMDVILVVGGVLVFLICTMFVIINAVFLNLHIFYQHLKYITLLKDMLMYFHLL